MKTTKTKDKRLSIPNLEKIVSINLKANLKGANLKGANLREVNFERAAKYNN